MATGQLITGWAPDRRTLADAYKPRAPIQYLINPFLPPASVTMLYGIPGCLKTLLAIYWGMCIATGTPCLLPGPGQTVIAFQVLQAAVLLIDFDNGPRVSDERIEAFGRAMKAPPSTQFSYYTMPDPQLNLSIKSHVDDVISLIRFEGAQFVIIDNLMTISGGKDENSSEMSPIITGLRRVATVTGAALLPIHHTTKNGGKGASVGSTLRGHSSINGSIDTGLLVEREPHTDNITISAEKTRGAPIPPFSAQFVYTHKPGTHELETASFAGIANVKAKNKPDIPGAIMQVLQSAGGQPMNQTNLVKKVHNLIGVAEQKVIDELTGMALKMQINQKTGAAHNSTLYWI